MAPVFKQQYFRTAFQDLMNQELVIQGPLHGYGKITTGVVGVFPRTRYLSKNAKQGDPYPFNPNAAKTLLEKNGWAVQPNGTTSCPHAALCGKGVTSGMKLSFTIDYAGGLAWLEAELLQLKANASELGINITLKPMSFQDVINRTVGDCGAAQNGPCPWSIDDWGSPGWSYVPDYLPTGDEIFQSTAGANLGKFKNQHDDKLIAATLKSSNPSLMWKWENYLTAKLPVVLQPDAPYELVESINNLQIGVQSPTLALNPEQWYFVR
jgi:peptide/nickel transport system substrate-binding protein